MSTQLIRFLYNVQPKHQGSVVTLGNFDGVHIGHQQLLAKTLEKAKNLGAPSMVITFEPHAFEYFSGSEVTIPRLTRFREKFKALSACGVDYVLLLKFNQQLASLSASEFIHQIYEAVKPVHVVIGDDFHFGKDRKGDLFLLSEIGKTLGFTTQALPSILFKDERISSTRVRKALAEGDLELAKQLLGRSYTLMGRVAHGDKRGRQWGFPTANIFLHRKLTPVHGVYTVLLHGISKNPLPGAANVGMRPTVDGTRTLLEVHLLDFNQDIYGRYVKVEFCKKLRDEARFSNVELLKEQIANDVKAARDYFGQPTR